MSQTMTVSVTDVGLDLCNPQNRLSTPARDVPAFTDYFDWEVAREEAEDATDARLTRRLYETAGLEGFVRVR